jgi:hypothetical protein
MKSRVLWILKLICEGGGGGCQHPQLVKELLLHHIEFDAWFVYNPRRCGKKISPICVTQKEVANYFNHKQNLDLTRKIFSVINLPFSHVWKQENIETRSVYLCRYKYETLKIKVV